MRYWFVAFAFTFLISCSSPPSGTSTLWPQILLKPTYAEGFEVRANGEQLQVVIRRKGEVIRITELKGPIHAFACLSTTHLSMFLAIHEETRVKAIGYAHLINDILLREVIQNNAIANLTTGDDIDREILFASKPDVLLSDPFQSVNETSFASQGIQIIPIGEYLEPHPLGRAEWIRLIGVLCGKSELADSLFLSIVDRYQTTRKQVSDFHIAQKIPSRVLFTSHESGEWFAPPGNSAVAHLLRDAGMNYLFGDSLSDRNIQLSREEIIGLGDQIEWWGELVRMPGKLNFESLKNDLPAFQSVNAFRSKQGFYCNSAQSDYFGKAMLEPDVLLADLVQVFYPGEFADRNPVYFFRIAKKTE